MSFRTRRILFMAPLHMLFYFFLLKYTFALVGGLWDGYVLLLTAVLGLLHTVPMFFEAKKSRAVTRFLSNVYGIWLWVAVMLLIDIVVIYAVGNFVNLSGDLILIMLAAVPVLGIYNYYKAHRLVVNEKTLEIEGLGREINIAHLSDVHFGSLRHKKLISDISSKLKELENVCDIAIISGDLADGSCIVEKDDFAAFGNVSMPVVFTPGNHDFYPGIDNVVRACKNAGIIVLDNENYEFKNLNIYGMTFSFDEIEMPTQEELKGCINPEKVNIINYHVPSFWEEFSSLGYDIQLSGHTHGGQFYPAVWFAERMFGYNKGLFKNNLGKYLHVTTGVGSMDTPMRWGTDSEIVVLKLKSK